MQKLTKQEVAFRRVVRTHYRKHGRTLPWRNTKDPYRICVSEVMLQQTPVSRVLDTYVAFLEMFPTASALASAPLSAVLRAWQGLGYNRRAKMLRACAQEITHEYNGIVPATEHELRTLPGIGPYTAAAVCAFAYEQPVVMIETNIRSAYLYHFFRNKKNVPDADIRPYIECTLDRARPREWYYALMDYGAYLKRTVGNQNVHSKHYTRQSAFTGSDRQIRGGIVRELAKAPRTPAVLARALAADPARVAAQLAALSFEGMVERVGRGWRLAS